MTITPVRAGTLVESGSAAFGQPTTAGNLLLAWVSTNDSSATFGVTCNNGNWVLAGSGGAAFNWVSVWYRPDCGAAETAPVFSSGGSDIWTQLAEFAGAAISSPADQTAASLITENYPAAQFTSVDGEGGELVAGNWYWNGSTAGGTVTLAVAGDGQAQFTDSDGGSIPSTLTTGANVFGQYAANIYGVAGITGSDTHTARLALSLFATGYGVIASFKPASPLTAPLTAATFSLPGRFTGVPYSASVAVTGGTPSYTWSVTAGSLPTGLSLSASTGAITGTPSVAGAYSFTIGVTDSASASVSMPLSILVTASPAVVFTTTYPPTQNGIYVTPAADPQFSGIGPSGDTFTNSNVDSPSVGATQVTSVQNVRQWSIAANFNDPSAAVHTFPNTGAQFPLSPVITWQDLDFIVTGWDVYMDSEADIVASACYDLFFDQSLVGQTSGIPGSGEVMAHFDFRNRGGGPYFATGVQFGGYTVAGYVIPATTWSLAWVPGGGAAFWNLGAPAGTYSGMATGAIDWKPMFQYLVTANILPANANLQAFSLGFEVCNTAGNTNTFLYNNMSWHGIGPPSAGPQAPRPPRPRQAVTVPVRIGRH